MEPQLATPVSVIVPTRNSARTLEACLRSIRQQTHSAIELIVVDNFSEDATHDVATRFADVVLRCGPERSAQRNEGLRAASGDVVLFIDSDMVLEAAVVAEVVNLLASDAGVSSVVIPEQAMGQGFWVRCRELEKRLYLNDPAVEAARGFRRDEVLAVGGYDERLWSAEDWDLADRMRTDERGTARTTSVIWHDEGRLQLASTFAKKRYYGRGFVTYLGVRGDQHQGRRSLRRRTVPRMLGRVVHEPVLVVGLAVLKSVEIAGFACGMVPVPSR